MSHAAGLFNKDRQKLARRGFPEHSLPVVTDETISPEQIDMLRRMTPEQRWRASQRLYWTLRRHKAAFLQSQHPHWTAGRIEEEVRNIFMHART